MGFLTGKAGVFHVIVFLQRTNVVFLRISIAFLLVLL